MIADVAYDSNESPAGPAIRHAHAHVYSEDGYDWLVHHAYDAEQDYESVLNIRRLVWDEAGWPSACVAEELG